MIFFCTSISSTCHLGVGSGRFRVHRMRTKVLSTTLERANTNPASDSDDIGLQSFRWQVQLYTSNLTFLPVYFLWLNPGTSQGFTSHYFNITNQAESTSASISLTTPTSLTPSPTNLIAAPTLSALSRITSDTAHASHSSASSLSETGKVGLGVGLGIGIPLVLIVGMWISLKLVKQRRSPSREAAFGMPVSQFPEMKYSSDPHPFSNDSTFCARQIHEAPGQPHKYHEAPGDRALVELS